MSREGDSQSATETYTSDQLIGESVDWNMLIAVEISEVHEIYVRKVLCVWIQLQWTHNLNAIAYINSFVD